MKWRNWFKKHKMIWVALCIVLLAALALSTFNGGQEEGAAGFMATVLLPVRSAMNSVGQFFGDMFRTGELRAQIAGLVAENQLLQNENRQIEQLKLENQRLSKLLEYQTTHTQLSPVLAKVIARSPGGWFSEFKIDQGTNQGIAKDMAVVNEQGLIGRVTAVGPNWATVVSIIDSRSAVAVMVERTRDSGIVQGSYTLGKQEDLCQLTSLPFDRDLVPGDRVITNGWDEIFPKGLYIGQVSQVSSGDGGEDFDIVTPAVDFAHIELVLVLRTNPQGTQP